MKIFILTAVVFLQGISTSYSQIEMNSAGRVGIGTTPDGSYILNTTTLKTSGLNYFSGSVGIGTAPSGSYKLYVSGDTYISTGEVGIGTAPSSYKLSVSGQTHFTFSNTAPGFTFVTNTGVAPGVYISGDATWDLYVSGSAYATGTWTSSDARFKKNIAELDRGDILSKLANIGGRKYEFRTQSELNELFQNTSARKDFGLEPPQFDPGVHYGLIAQEVETEFPELVKDDPLTGLKAINYDGMIPILLEAIKAQQGQMDSLKKEIVSLREGSSYKDLINPPSIMGATLGQNNPNPFSANTHIDYFLPESVSKATLNIYDMNGRQLKSMPIESMGDNSITIRGGEFRSGIYLYALIADGQVIDTRKMILTD